MPRKFKPPPQEYEVEVEYGGKPFVGRYTMAPP